MTSFSCPTAIRAFFWSVVVTTLLLVQVVGQSPPEHVFVGDDGSGGPKMTVVDTQTFGHFVTISGISQPLDSVTWSSSSPDLFVGAGNAVYRLDPGWFFPPYYTQATLQSTTPGHVINPTLFIGANGIPVATSPGGSFLACPSGGGPATNLFPAPPWLSLDVGGFDPITGEYLAVAQVPGGRQVFRINPTCPYFRPLGPPLTLAPVTDLFSDGAGGVYLSDGDLHRVNALGSVQLRVGAAQTTSGTICGIAQKLNTYHQFYAWSCGGDDVDQIDGSTQTAVTWIPGTLGGGSAVLHDMLRFAALPPYFKLTATTNAGDLLLDVENIPAGSNFAMILASRIPAPCGRGTGPALGLWPDSLFFTFLLAPPVPGSYFHFPTSANPYAIAPLTLPPGVFIALSGQVWELTAIAYGNGGFKGQSNFRTLVW
ncbi:MAG: hypothetical protein CMJ83_06495 [Planctomycetes bacterium]|nr:hypothetical protein [Planctomycetota bacterium]